MEEFHADAIGSLNVVTSVFVECHSEYYQSGPELLRPVGETEFVERLTREFALPHQAEPVVSGIVGHADLRSDDVDQVLQAHITAGGGRFRGVRYMTAVDPSPLIRDRSPGGPDALADAQFRAGVAALGRASLSFDAFVYHPQLPQLAELARAQPDTIIILNHLGGPLAIGPYAAHRDEVLEQWKAGMREVARCANVFLKLSGIGMPMFGCDWQDRSHPPSSQDIADEWGDRIHWCIELFGAARCMFASNFPVDRMSCSYVVLWNAFKRMVTGASASEMARLFHDSASVAYRLEPSTM